MTTIETELINGTIDALKELTAEEYCKDEVARIYADFEASKEKKIADLEIALEVYEKYQVVEAEDVEEPEEAEASVEVGE